MIKPAIRRRSPEVEPEGRERSEIALRDDDKDTKKSCGKPRGLHWLQPVAEQSPSRQRNEHRTGRAQHEPVQSFCPDKSEIGKRIVAARPDRPQKQEHPPASSDDGGVVSQMRPCEGEEDERGECPAQAGERHGRDFADNSAAENEIASPEYRDQSEKQPRPVEERSHGAILWLSSKRWKQTHESDDLLSHL